MPSWSDVAKKQKIRYFLISFVDLFGTMRAKIVPASAIGDVAKAGAGFAGFATWFDMTPSDPDVLVMPEMEPSSNFHGNPKSHGSPAISTWAGHQSNKIRGKSSSA